MSVTKRGRRHSGRDWIWTESDWVWTESDWLWTESNHDGHWIRVSVTKRGRRHSGRDWIWTESDWVWTESDFLWTESNLDCLWIRVLQSVEGDRRVEIGYGQNQTMMVIGFVCYKAWKATVVSRLVSRLAVDRIKP